MPLTASLSRDLRTVAMHSGDDWLETPVPGGWDEVQRLDGKVLLVDGVPYGYTGWNSDRLVAYFKRGGPIGRLV